MQRHGSGRGRACRGSLRRRVRRGGGRRGYALPRLQSRLGPMRATLGLAALWAGWHAPLFFILASYGDFNPLILPGAFVLTSLYNNTGGSILAVAVWHASLQPRRGNDGGRRHHRGRRHRLRHRLGRQPRGTRARRSARARRLQDARGEAVGHAAARSDLPPLAWACAWPRRRTARPAPADGRATHRPAPHDAGAVSGRWRDVHRCGFQRRRRTPAGLLPEPASQPARPDRCWWAQRRSLRPRRASAARPALRARWRRAAWPGRCSGRRSADSTPAEAVSRQEHAYMRRCVCAALDVEFGHKRAMRAHPPAGLD